MRPRRGWFVGLALIAALFGCDVDHWLRAGGVRAFREVELSEARLLLEEPDVALLQVRSPREPRATLPDAEVISERAPLPADFVASVERVLVLARNRGAGRRVAARLVRAGVPRVALLASDPAELNSGIRVARPLGESSASKLHAPEQP